MAIRVRKLAKQLKRNPAELIGVLHGIGVSRYTSPEDMISGPIEAKLRQALRDGVRPVTVELKGIRKQEPVRAAPAPRPPQEHLEQAPVPVVAPAPPIAPAPAALIEALTAERQALAQERQALAEMRSTLQADVERGQNSPTTSLLELLEQRGLVGQDEAERAIRSLAERRRLVELLPFLTVSEPGNVARLLREILVLVDGVAPPALASEAVVAVAPERAEIPSAAAFRRQTEQLSEQLLLNGARRVLVVGGPIRLQRVLAKALDPRIELRFRPAVRVVASDATADVTRTDAVVLWNVEVDDAANEVYQQGRAIVCAVQSERLDGLFRQWQRGLAG